MNRRDFLIGTVGLLCGGTATAGGLDLSKGRTGGKNFAGAYEPEEFTEEQIDAAKRVVSAAAKRVAPSLVPPKGYGPWKPNVPVMNFYEPDLLYVYFDSRHLSPMVPRAWTFQVSVPIRVALDDKQTAIDAVCGMARLLSEDLA